MLFLLWEFYQFCLRFILGIFVVVDVVVLELSYFQVSIRAFVVYWPPTRPNMPFQRRRKCIFNWRGRAWLTIWDVVKIHRYSHRQMHRKRVTCELHDSYFRSMTIKHAIPKTAEATHSDGQLWGDTEWVIELLYNSVKTGSQFSWRAD